MRNKETCASKTNPNKPTKPRGSSEEHLASSISTASCAKPTELRHCVSGESDTIGRDQPCSSFKLRIKLEIG
jgi:hypothetical protein